MDLCLKDKRVLVTGSSSGIGLAISKAFHDEGACVTVNGRDEKKLEDVSIGSSNFYRVPADVTDPSQAEELIRKSSEAMGGIDIVICNVGSGKSVVPGSETRQDWEDSIAMNFFSAINVITPGIVELKKSSGSIVCISSICGMEVVPGAPVTYSASKSALNAYIRGMSRPFGELGIKINGVAPGNIVFPGSVWQEKLAADSPAVELFLEREVPLKKLGEPSDVSSLVLWLASSKSNFATGSIHTVDGGQTRC